jgi:excisionase family DNA binding protein
MRLLNQKEAAEYLRVSTSKLYKMTHRREIPFIKMGSKNIFSLDDLSEYILNNRVLTAAELVNQSFTEMQKYRKL